MDFTFHSSTFQHLCFLILFFGTQVSIFLPKGRIWILLPPVVEAMAGWTNWISNEGKLITVAGPWYHRGLADVASIRLCNLGFFSPWFYRWISIQWGRGRVAALSPIWLRRSAVSQPPYWWKHVDKVSSIDFFPPASMKKWLCSRRFLSKSHGDAGKWTVVTLKRVLKEQPRE